ncbi:DMT family transporter [Puteibacter caeruleilacunae]|nr:DMT family transporter [Puteibacter caeruleilacunae]
MKDTKLGVYVAIVLSMLFWSLSFVWVKIVYVSYKPITTVFLRLIISSIILIIFGLITKKVQIPEKKELKYLLLLSFFEPFLYFMGESFGMLYVSSTLGSVIIATIPLFAPVAAWYFYKERLATKNLMGIIISFIGVSVVVLNRDFSLKAAPIGLALMFVAVFAAVGYTVVLNRLSHKYNPISIILYQNFIGIFLFLPFWLIFDMKDFMATPYDSTAMIAIVKLSIFASSLAFILFTYSLKFLGIGKSNTFINAIPVFTAIFAFFILGDKLTVQKFAGIAIVISGLFLSQLKTEKLKSWKISNITQPKSLKKNR